MACFLLLILIGVDTLRNHITERLGNVWAERPATLRERSEPAVQVGNADRNAVRSGDLDARPEAATRLNTNWNPGRSEEREPRKLIRRKLTTELISSVGDVSAIEVAELNLEELKPWLMSEELARDFDGALKNAAAQWSGENVPQRIKGKGIRKLASTAALAAFYMGNSEVDVQALWGGDSRCYFLDHKGLMALTRDDVKHESEVHAALSSDSPLSNFLSEVGSITLNQDGGRFSLPGGLICCTDGPARAGRGRSHMYTE